MSSRNWNKNSWTKDWRGHTLYLSTAREPASEVKVRCRAQPFSCHQRSLAVRVQPSRSRQEEEEEEELRQLQAQLAM